MGNRSLDDFTRGKAVDDSPSDDTDSVTSPPTSAWHPEGRACEDCATVVIRRWHADGKLVCADCKPWA